MICRSAEQKMNSKRKMNSLNSRHKNLSLKKNKLEKDDKPKKFNRSSDVIILEESFDKYRMDISKNLKLKTYSPIVVNDSCTLSDDDLPKVTLSPKTPSYNGKFSFDCSNNQMDLSPTRETHPSTLGWSPAQQIITANPKNDLLPSTPKDKHNESREDCSMKTVERSQKKILNELYGETWKSIPSLFKTISHKYDNFDGITRKLFDDGDKENVRHVFKKDKEIYLTSSEVKRNEAIYGTEKKSKKKLYTEKVPSTPDVPTQKISRNVNSTTKKIKINKAMSVTEIVKVMNNDVDNDKKLETAEILMNKIENDILTNTGKNVERENTLKDISNKTKKEVESEKIVKDTILTNKQKNVETKTLFNDEILAKGKSFESERKHKNEDILTNRIEKVVITPKKDVKRLSFMGSLAENVPTWRCHPEAFQYRDNYKALKEQLSRRLYKEFNKEVFGDAMDADMPILWDSKLRSTAGTTTNSQIKNARGDRIRSSKIKLSTKVLTTPQRLRDTLIHEMCHAATWIIDSVIRAGHGPLWKKWAKQSLRVFPELGEILRCHDMEIHFKYSYQCTQCGYTIKRHSKSIDITMKACGYCRGTFQIVLNKKNKAGVVVPKPAKKAINGFALYVKENYASVKDSTKTHAQVMKLLGEQYAVNKNKKTD